MVKNKIVVTMLIMALCLMLTTSVSALTATSISNTAMEGETFEGTITLTNDEAVNITGISLTREVLTFGGETISTSDISISPNSITKLDVGESVDVIYEVTLDYGVEEGVYTGLVGLAYNNGSAQNKDVDVELNVLDNPNKLMISDVDIKIDGKKKNVDEDDEFDVQLGDEIEITVEIENLYTDDDDIRLEDVEVCIENDDLDWDDCEDINDIREDDKESVTFNFVIDYDVDSDDSPFTIEIDVDSEDEDNNDHSDSLEFDLNLDKERDEIMITDLYVSPSVVTCYDQSVRLNIEIFNTGRDDQTTAVLEISADRLDFKKYIRSIDIDEGDRSDFDVIIPLEDDVSGEVIVDVNAYATSDEDDLTSVESVSFLITCDDDADDEEEVEEPEEEEEDDNMEIVVPVVPTTPSDPAVQTSVGQKKNFINSSDGLYISLLIIIAVLLLVLVIVLAANLARKK